jgi:hypothetical protein
MAIAETSHKATPARRGPRPTLVTPEGSTQSPVQMHTARQIWFPPRSIPDAHSQVVEGIGKRRGEEERAGRGKCGHGQIF